MSVTFLIGNGFDLHMGMKTRYVDVYDGYIKSKSKSKVIENFKELLKKDAPNEYMNWSDFEQKMGESTDKFESEQDFINCVRDFKEHLAKHLENEEKNFIDRIGPRMRDAISLEMKNSLFGFYHSLINKDKRLLEHLTLGKHYYYFISFNYTSVLSKLLSFIRLSDSELNKMILTNPVYLNGKLDSGIVLGVDNEEQLNSDCNYKFTTKIKRAFLKPVFNDIFDPEKVNDIYNRINDSDVICVYGLSFGKTDLKWVEIIIDWLKSNANHQLVYFKYSNKEYNLWHKDLMMDVEDEFKDELLKQINYANHNSINELFDQVHIPIGYDIFNIKEIIEEAEKASKTIEKGKKAVDDSLLKMKPAMIPKENAFN